MEIDPKYAYELKNKKITFWEMIKRKQQLHLQCLCVWVLHISVKKRSKSIVLVYR